MQHLSRLCKNMRRCSDKRLPRPEIHVRHFIHVARNLGQVRKLAMPQNLVARQFERQVGDHAAKINISAALTDAVDRPLNLCRPVPDRRQGVRNRQLAVIMRVNPDRRADCFSHCLHSLGHFVR